MILRGTRSITDILQKDTPASTKIFGSFGFFLIRLGCWEIWKIYETTKLFSVGNTFP